MQKHGKYFQRGLIEDEFIEGEVMNGLRYGGYNDNQIVPILTLKNLELVDQTNSTEKK